MVRTKLERTSLSALHKKRTSKTASTPARVKGALAVHFIYINILWFDVSIDYFELLTSLLVFRMSLADLEIIAVSKHEINRDGIVTCVLLEVIGVNRHLAFSDCLGECYHAVT